MNSMHLYELEVQRCSFRTTFKMFIATLGEQNADHFVDRHEEVVLAYACVRVCAYWLVII